MTYPSSIPLVNLIYRGEVNLWDMLFWGETYEEPGVPFAIDWLFSELLQKRINLTCSSLQEYQHYAYQQNLEKHRHRGASWWARENWDPGPNKSYVLGFHRKGEDEPIKIALLSCSSERKVIHASTTLSRGKLDSSMAWKPVVAYLEAWEACGDRLPGLILDGNCPVELPEIKL